MALTIKEALRLLESGDAEKMLKEFVIKSLLLSYRSQIEECDEMTRRSHEIDLVAALAIDMLLKTPDGRKALSLKRRARGKDWRASDYVGNEKVVDLVLRFHRGQIDKAGALAELDRLVSTPHVRPDLKTVERLLGDLEDKITHNMDLTEILLMAGSGRLQDEADVERVLRSTYRSEK
jgi:hypothetical protein